jgi:hypothetical protein
MQSHRSILTTALLALTLFSFYGTSFGVTTDLLKKQAEKSAKDQAKKHVKSEATKHKLPVDKLDLH